METYKVSDLFRRAKQLADLEGSDFITWNEAVNCINESYIGLFQKLIAMGDNSYVKDYHTTKSEPLPSDFWQLKGVYLWNNGNLETINRRADNNGIHHLSYELKNGNLELYGSPNDVYVQYYPKPMTLIMPPLDKEINLNLPEGAVLLDCYAHTFLYTVQDEEQNYILNIYDLDGIKTATNILTTWETDRTFITRDFVYSVTSSGLAVYDIALGAMSIFENALPLVTESGDFYIIYDGYINELIDTELEPLTEFNIEDNGYLYISDDDLSDFYSLTDTSINHNGTSLNQKADKIIYSDNKCYYIAFNKLGVIDEEENKTIRNSIGAGIGFISINSNTGYGYATKKYNKVWVCPYCEDTLLNFPNSFYYQILSYMLAIAFRCKQNADVTLLSSQLAKAEETFNESLGSDSFQFTRMGNVYR